MNRSTSGLGNMRKLVVRCRTEQGQHTRLCQVGEPACGPDDSVRR